MYYLRAVKKNNQEGLIGAPGPVPFIFEQQAISIRDKIADRPALAEIEVVELTPRQAMRKPVVSV